jgi:hypothetical protein
VAQASSAAPATNADIFFPSRFSSRPTPVPVISVSGTTTAANRTVVRTDSQNSGSVRVWVKLASPTHCVGRAPVSWGRP